MTNKSTMLLEHNLKQLKLPTFLREYDKLASQCASEGADHPDYLLRLSELELIDRHHRMVERRIKAARFPTTKSLDTFDFLSMPSLNKALVLELARCEYIERPHNVIALGNSGTGKTHIALGLGLAACQRGLSVGFTTAAALVHELIEARDERRLLNLQRRKKKKASRVPGSGVRGRGSGERETTASSLTGKHEARERRTTVVKERMDLLELLHKGGMDGDVDFLREALRVLVEGIMDAEVSSRIGAEYGERSPERVTQRNGYRSRAWDTRVGTMELHIPKLREGSYFPSLLEPRRRSERALLAVIQQAYVEGVSTRRVDDLVKALGCDGISKSQVSRICQDLDVVVEGFLGRPLDGGPYPYPYLWLDALTQKVREDGRIVNVSVVVATAVNGEGKREIIGMDVGTSEDGAFWLAFLRSLSARGLGGVELVVSDAHQGLRGAIAAVFGGASWQRCRTHFMTNLLTRVPRRAQPWVATMVRTIYQQPSPDEVHAQLDRVTSQLQDRFPQVASLLDEAGPDILAFSSFPVSHWKKLWSNNPLERLNKEIRRRTDVVAIFPNRPAVRRLVGAVLDEQHDEWAVGRRYLTPAILTFNEALPEADVAEDTAA